MNTRNTLTASAVALTALFAFGAPANAGATEQDHTIKNHQSSFDAPRKAESAKMDERVESRPFYSDLLQARDVIFQVLSYTLGA